MKSLARNFAISILLFWSLLLPLNALAQAPIVSNVAPGVGIAGTQVTFTGTGFGAAQSGNVWLGSTYGAVVSWSDTQVVATIVSGAKSGTAQILQNGAWSSAISLTVITPSVTSVTPSTGMAGTQVTFTGTGFGATQGGGNVWLGSTYGSVVSWSDTQIVATVAAGSQSGTAQILQGGVWSDVISFTVITPKVTSVTPTSAMAGVQVTFTGTGFGVTQGSGNVWLGSTYGTVVSWSDTQVVATVAAGSKSGTAQILQGGVWSDVINFPVTTPKVTSVTPTSATAGTQVTFVGTGFGSTQGSGNVWLGSTYGIVVSWSNTLVVATVSAGSKSGTAQILQGDVWSDVINFTVTTPKVTSVTPTIAMTGTQVTFTGTGFGATQGSGNVWLGSTYGVIVSWSDTQIVATVVSGAKSGTAQVLQGGVWSDVINFTVVTPSVTVVSPGTGVAGTQVTFTGTGFGATQGSGNVWLGSTYGTVVSWSDTRVVATVASGAKSGTAQILQGGVWSDVIAFTVVTPIVTNVSPARGLLGTQITITGTGFGATQGSGNVWLGSTYGIVMNWSDTQVVATVATGAQSGTAQILQGGVWSDPVNFTINSSGPLLQFSVADTPLQVNLTSPQTLDWIHWGRISATTPDRKAGSAPLISDYTASNTQPQTGTGTVKFSWTDGNHPPVVSEANEAVQTFDANGGFQITVPADTTVKTLNLYTQVFFGQAQLQASLSDGSATAITDQSVIDTNVGSKIYSIDFRAASAGQTLTVTVSAVSGGVGLQAATLTPHLPSVAVTSPTVAQSFGAQDTVPLSATATQFDNLITDVSLNSGGVFFEAPNPPYNASLVPGTTGHYSVVATATDSAGLVSASEPVEFDVIGQGGTLSIDEVAPSSPIDLNAQGTGDWVLWGPLNTGDFIINNPGNIMARKSGVAPLISDYTPIGNHPITSTTLAHPLCFLGDQQNYCSGSQLVVHGLNDGYQITVAADTTPLTLQLYVGARFGDGKLMAFLSDGSAAVATEVGGGGPPPPPANHTTLYTINYSAASSGQTLTVRFTLNSDQGGGELDLIGAALSGPSITPIAPAPQIASIDPGTGQTNTKVTLAGTNFGTTQGNGQVLFGQVSAQVATWSDTSISVTVPATISQGSTVGVTVLNDNGTSNRVSFTVPAYSIFPTSLNMLVGQSRTLSVKDSSGNPVSGLQWTASDLTVVSFSTDDPPVITALAPGTAKVYAGDLGIPVTVYAGSSLPAGTPIWSLPLGGGLGIASLVPAVPSDSGADVFVLDNSGMLTAVSAEGEPVWHVPVGNASKVIPDFSGNAFINKPTSYISSDIDLSVAQYHLTQGQHFTHKVSRVDPATRTVTDLYTYAGQYTGVGFVDQAQTPIAEFADSIATQAIPSPTGVLFVQDVPRVVVFDTTTNQPISTIDIDSSTIGKSGRRDSISGQMIVAGDGNAYVPYVYTSGSAEFGPLEAGLLRGHLETNLMLLRVSPDGTYTKIPLNRFTLDVDNLSGEENCSGTFLASGTVLGDSPFNFSPYPANYLSLSVVTNADQGVAVISPVPTSPCNGPTIAGPQTVMTLVSHDAVAGQMTLNIGNFQPTLQREDGSYIGTESNNWLDAVALDGTVLWQKKINPDVNGNPTPVTPMYATADGGAIVTSSTTTQDGTKQFGSLFTLDKDGNQTSQTPDTGAVYSWRNNWYSSNGGPAQNGAASLVRARFGGTLAGLSPSGDGLQSLPLQDLSLAPTWAAILAGNASDTPVAIQQSLFPELVSCLPEKADQVELKICQQNGWTAATGGPREWISNGLKALEEILAIPCDPASNNQFAKRSCQIDTYVFTSRLKDANGSQGSRIAFLSFLRSNTPAFYDGTLSTHPRCHFTAACTDHLTIANDFADGDIKAETVIFDSFKPPAIPRMRTFFRPTIILKQLLGVTGTNASANMAAVFHEALHSYTRLADTAGIMNSAEPSLKKQLGCVETLAGGTGDITAYLRQFTIDGARTTIDPCSKFPQ
ncbi:MAG TPA: IPT/TIG domain-containing protein [Candidatus Angelobacter sp.]|jgi:hypothetical protein|nr:IPT/TIG domain-containing protein [Candidatus Angelobacter sp.]